MPDQKLSDGTARNPLLSSDYFPIIRAGANDLVAPDVVKAYMGATVQYADISLSSAEILALFTTPKQLVAAPGANKAVFPLFISMSLVFVSVAYATNVQLQVKAGSSTLYLNSLVLPNASDYFARGAALPVAASGGGFDFINAPLVLAVGSGNPTAGNGTLKVRVIYEVVDIL